MLKNIIHFLKYNNLATLIVAAVLVGSGWAFAASPELRAAAGDAFIGRTETVVAIDNAAILNADLAVFDPALVITAVSEDAERYLVSYRLATFDVVGGAWQKTERTGELKIAKNALGNSDLRAYVTKELGEVARQEIRYLKEAQIAEREKGVTKQVVAVSYSGLLGLVIDPQEKIAEPEPVERPAEIARAEATNDPLLANLGIRFPSEVTSTDSQSIINNLVVQPLSEEIALVEEVAASSTPSAIELTTSAESATTTEQAIIVAPATPIDGTSTTTSSTNAASTTPVI